MDNDLELIKEAEEDSIWLDENLDEIRASNVNKFVAIRDKSIILAHSNLDTLLKMLEKRKENLDRLMIEFIYSEDWNFIL